MTSGTADLPSIHLDDSIREAMRIIDEWAKGIALVLDPEGHLIDTVTDGDVRRAILAGLSPDDSISSLLTGKPRARSQKPLTAALDTERSTLLRMMQEREVRQIPLLDSDGHVAGLVTLNDLLPDQVLPLQAVIMAGGLGTRLRPLTENLPKPMLPVGDRPLMELIIEQLRQAGIHQVNVTTHHMAAKIVEHFGDGSRFGVKLNYVTEDLPLGTAGALGTMDVSQEPLLVINGDVLTQVDFRTMLAYHREHGADLTVAVRQYDLQVPYGVVECEGHRVCRVREKPLLRFLVNAGIYLLEPSVRGHIPNGRPFDMTDLIQELVDEGRPVVSFPIVEYWLDVGQHADYQKAQDDMRAGRLRR